MTPNPVEAPPVQPDQHADRELYCIHYGSHCLPLAARLSWDNFSCGLCPIRGTCNDDPRMVDQWVTAAAPAARALVESKPRGKNGPNGNWERAWQLFVERETWTPQQIADRLGITNTAAHDTLRTLVYRDKVAKIGPALYGRVAS